MGDHQDAEIRPMKVVMEPGALCLALPNTEFHEVRNGDTNAYVDR